MNLEDFVLLEGDQDGPTSVVLGGVHGDEVCGVEALQKLLPELSISRGRVWFGYGNPRAIEQNERKTEANLNRMFKPDEMLTDADRSSYEYGRAQLIRSYLDQADALLDVHASFTEGGTPFVLCESNARGIMEHLPFDLVVHGFDEVEPGGTDYYMNVNGKVGICVECGYLGDPESSIRAEQSIIQFLVARGHMDGSLERREQGLIRMYELYLTKTDAFRLVKKFDDFELVEARQIIAYDGDEPITPSRSGIILFARQGSDGKPFPAGSEAFLLGEKIY